MSDLLGAFGLYGALALAALLGVLLLSAIGSRHLPSQAITVKPLLNRSEQTLRSTLLKQLAAEGHSDHHVFAQVSYGEFLRTKDRKLFWSFNAKRADLVIAGPDYTPIAVIEYQGAGHRGRRRRDGRDADQRDAVKRRILARAGLPLIEVPTRWSGDALEDQLKAVLAEFGTRQSMCR